MYIFCRKDSNSTFEVGKLLFVGGFNPSRVILLCTFRLIDFVLIFHSSPVNLEYQSCSHTRCGATVKYQSSHVAFDLRSASIPKSKKSMKDERFYLLLFCAQSGKKKSQSGFVRYFYWRCFNCASDVDRLDS